VLPRVKVALGGAGIFTTEDTEGTDEPRVAYDGWEVLVKREKK